MTAADLYPDDPTEDRAPTELGTREKAEHLLADAPTEQAEAANPSTQGEAEPAPAPDLAEPDRAAEPEALDKSQPSDPVAELAAEVGRLAAAVATFSERSAGQEQLALRMHERLQELQAGETKQLLKPVIAGLVALLGDLLKQSQSITRDLTPTEASDLFEVFALRIENTLGNLGLESFAPKPGDDIDPRRHQAVTTTTGPDAAAAGKVASVVRPGFGDPSEPKVAFPAQVAVYEFIVPEAEPELELDTEPSPTGQPDLTVEPTLAPDQATPTAPLDVVEAPSAPTEGMTE